MNQKVAVAVVFVMAMFMAIMDVTIVNVAIPKIGTDFHTSPTSVGAISVGFLVSLAVVIPASGWLGDRFGSRRILLLAIFIFTVASALCGFAQDFPQLVGFRVLQGVGGGMLTPVGLAMLFRAFPPEERVRASSILMVPTAFAPALGPIVGGVLVTQLSWRWVFFVNLPVGVIAFVFCRLFVHEQKEPAAGRFDLVGFLLSGVGFASLMYGISEGPQRGWGSGVIVATLITGVVVIALLVVTQLRTSAPLLDLRLFQNGLFRSGNGVMFVGTASFLGTLYVVSLFFQDGLHMSALDSGLSTFPEALGVLVGSQSATRIFYRRFGPRRVITSGLVGVALTVALMALIDNTGELWWMRTIMFFLGLAMAHAFVPSQAATFAGISPARTGRASTLFNATRQLGGAMGVAVLSSSLAAVGISRVAGGRPVPNITAYHVTFLVAAGLAVCGALCALTIDDDAAAATRGLVTTPSRIAEPEAAQSGAPLPVQP